MRRNIYPITFGINTPSHPIGQETPPICQSCELADKSLLQVCPTQHGRVDAQLDEALRI